MTDNNDGTYSYTWTPDNEGKLSVSVVHYNRYSIKGTYYNTRDLTGSVAATNYSSTINYSWGNANVTTIADYVSSEYEAYLKAPITGSLTLYLYVDNEGALWVDGVQKFNRFGSPCVCTDTTTITVTKDQYYHIVARFAEYTGGATVIMYWSYTGQAKTVIPADNWFYPGYVGSSPYTVTVT